MSRVAHRFVLPIFRQRGRRSAGTSPPSSSMTGPFDHAPGDEPPSSKIARSAHDAPVEHTNGAPGVALERTSAQSLEDEPTITAPDRKHFTVLLIEDDPGDARTVREM